MPSAFATLGFSAPAAILRNRNCHVMVENICYNQRNRNDIYKKRYTIYPNHFAEPGFSQFFKICNNSNACKGQPVATAAETPQMEIAETRIADIFRGNLKTFLAIAGARPKNQVCNYSRTCSHGSAPANTSSTSYSIPSGPPSIPTGSSPLLELSFFLCSFSDFISLIFLV